MVQQYVAVVQSFCDIYERCICVCVCGRAVLNTKRDDSNPHLWISKASAQYSSGTTAAATVHHQRTSQGPYIVHCIVFFVFFASVLSLVADSVLLSRCYTLPRAACEPANLRIPLPVSLFFFLAFFPFTSFSFLLFSFLFRFRFGLQFVSCCLFLVSIMLSPRFVFRLVQRVICIWYVRTLISLFLRLLGIRFVSVIVCIIFRFIFPPEVIFHSRVIGACPVATDCVVATS